MLLVVSFFRPAVGSSRNILKTSLMSSGEVMGSADRNSKRLAQEKAMITLELKLKSNQDLGT